MTYHDLIDHVIAHSIAHGAQQVSATLVERSEQNAEMLNGQLETIRSGSTEQLGIKIYKDGKFGQFSTNKLANLSSLNEFIELSIRSTSLLEVDPFRKLPDISFFSKNSADNLDIFDYQAQNFAPEKLIEMARATFEAGGNNLQAHIALQSAASVSAKQTYMGNSLGFRGSYASSNFGISLELSIKQEDDKRTEAYAYATSRWMNGLPKPAQITQEASMRAAEKLGETKILSGKYPMLVENRAAGRFISVLLSAMEAASVANGRSFVAKKLGEAIGGGLLDLTDTALIPQGLASKPFDNEGIACSSRELVTNGILRTFLVDSYYGNKLGMPINGGSTSNIVMGPATHSLEELKKYGKLIWIKGYNGGNANPLTGDFSYGVSGILIESDGTQIPVNEMVISGNILTLFHNLVAIADDPFQFSAIQSPTLLFDEVDFSGK